MEINVTNKNHLSVLQLIATIANKSSTIVDDKITIHDTNRVKSSEIKKTNVKHSKPVKMRCIGVPGKAFFIRSKNCISVTGNTMHVEGNSWLFRQVCSDNTAIVNDDFKRKIYDMARTIVDFEDAFIDFVYQDYVIEGLNKDEVKRYIRYIADRRLVQLGLKENWMIDENPLPWLDWILNATNHTNFFENKVSEYDVGGLQGNENWNSENIKFKIISRDGCPYCVKAKELIISEGFDAEIIEMNDKTERNAFYDSLGLIGKDRTVPQIWKIDENGVENYIGGYLELEKEF